MTHNPFYWRGLHPAKQALLDWNIMKIWCAFIDQHMIRFYTLVLVNVGSVCKWNQQSSLWMVCRHLLQNTNSVEHTQGALHYFLILPKSCYGPKLLSCIHWIRQAITLHCYYSYCISAFNCEASFDLISNCLFSATWTWVCCFCVEPKEHQWVGKEFSHFILLMPFQHKVWSGFYPLG